MDRMQTITSNPIKLKFIIISLLTAAAFIFIVGCASTAQKIGTNKYRTNCSGMFSSTQDCYNEASRVCDGKFTEINMNVVNQGDVWDGFCQCYIYVVHRNLTFACR